MHLDQFTIDVGLVRALLRSQFPALADGPITPVRSTGTVNALFRVASGKDDLLVRLPLQPGTTIDDLQREHQTWQEMAPVLDPWTVPEPVGIGEAEPGFPSPWSITRWISGTPLPSDGTATVDDADAQLARDLAEVVRRIAATPLVGRSRRGAGRGGLLSDVDGYVRDCFERDAAMIDSIDGITREALTSLWTQASEAPAAESRCLHHGDLMPANLLVRDGRLVAVIDWSALDVGDPAYDLMPAWNLFGPRERAVFLTTVAAEGDAVLRARGWALAQAIGCLGYYAVTNPAMSQLAVHTLRQTLIG